MTFHSLQSPRKTGQSSAVAVSFALFVLGIGSEARAGPRVISDNRVQLLTGVPNLGRGYSIHTNSLQSMCFEEVTATEPTFDFEYEIEEVTEDFFDALAANPIKRVQASYIREFLRKHMERADIATSLGNAPVRTLLAHLTITTYHHSLDETQSPLSASAKRLLRGGRYEAFFSSCGFFYIRSVRRFSSYLAVIQFNESGDEENDARFLNQLENGMLSFDTMLDDMPQRTRVRRVSKTAAEKGRDLEEMAAEDAALDMQKAAKERGLKVYIVALGLASGKFVNLVPASIKEFRDTIQSAASLMQNAEAGVISSIELAPWIDNPEIGVIFDDEAEEGSGIESFRSLHNLELNSQAIADINQSRSFHLQQFYFANFCERLINQLYPSNPDRAEEHQGRYYDPDRTLFYNMRDEGNSEFFITLREFKRHFERRPSWQLLDVVNDFLNGTESKPGALACIEELHEQGLDKANFATIPACVEALKGEHVDHMFLQEYCLPKPARLVFETPTEWWHGAEKALKEEEAEKSRVAAEEMKARDAAKKAAEAEREQEEGGGEAEPSGETPPGP